MYGGQTGVQHIGHGVDLLLDHAVGGFVDAEGGKGVAGRGGEQGWRGVGAGGGFPVGGVGGAPHAHPRFVEGGEIEVLSLQNQMEEYMFLGLRKIEGVSKTDFRQTFGRSIENAYGKVLIDMYQKQLLEDTGEYIRLTEKGIDVSNYVMSEFLF